jgi:hypothetical protein
MACGPLPNNRDLRIRQSAELRKNKLMLISFTRSMGPRHAFS